MKLLDIRERLPAGWQNLATQWWTGILMKLICNFRNNSSVRPPPVEFWWNWFAILGTTLPCDLRQWNGWEILQSNLLASIHQNHIGRYRSDKITQITFAYIYVHVHIYQFSMVVSWYILLFESDFCVLTLLSSCCIFDKSALSSDPGHISQNWISVYQSLLALQYIKTHSHAIGWQSSKFSNKAWICATI